MPNPPPLHPGCYYHIFNRGNNRESIFREPRNYAYFLTLYAKSIEPVAETYCYCLLEDHFHLLVRIKETSASEAEKPSTPSRAYANLFGTYAKAYNQAYNRSGSLFEKPFHRIQVAENRYLLLLVTYIHQNPVKHGYTKDFRNWPYSSYRAILGKGYTRIKRTEVLKWFQGRQGFIQAHSQEEDQESVRNLIGADD